MRQIIWNYLCLFGVPAAIGCVVRFLLRRLRRAYCVSIIFVILAAIAWIAAYIIPSRGSELYGIRALQVTATAAGSLLTGLVFFVKKRVCKDEK